MDLFNVSTRVNGLTMRALRSAGARPTDLTLVLVHGMVVASRSMVPLCEQFNRVGVSVWAPDLPGFGLSDKPVHALDVPSLGDALAAWIRATGLQRPVVLGNSFGTQVVAAFAARHPALLERLVLLSPTVDPALRRRVDKWARLPVIDVPWPRWMRRLQDRLARRLIDPVPDTGDYPPLWKLITTEYASAGLLRGIGTTRFALLDDIESHLADVRVPTLVARASDDRFSRLEWAQHLAREVLSDGTLVQMNGVDHDGEYTDADAIVEHVLPFVTSRASRRRQTDNPCPAR